MIEKVLLKINDALAPVLVEWNEGEEDFLIDVPNKISRLELITLVEEIKRITECED